VTPLPERVVIIAAGLVSRRPGGQVSHRDIARISCEVDLASEFRYREPVIGSRIGGGISQSGETADTLAAMKEAAARGHAPSPSASGRSAIPRASTWCCTPTRPGNRVAPPSASPPARGAGLAGDSPRATQRRPGRVAATELVGALMHIPQKMSETLKDCGDLKELARKYKDVPILFLGRGRIIPSRSRARSS